MLTFPSSLKMKRHNSGIYEYLKEKGLLNSPDKAAIAQAKQEYRRLYKKQWQKNRDGKTYKVFFDTEQLTYITKQATKRGISVTEYIRASALKDANSLQSIAERTVLNTLINLIRRHFSSDEYVGIETDPLTEEKIQRLTALKDELLNALYGH